ncbi:hypothetical protein [Minwuia thermotolerans]|uniref:Uncharacterized protein n=1 Tax=Minwuia thermotolerans TaxID=2056226 RepID=A0A2M9FWR7_9PROT|nr:hypothetical protein [Minwuia thermotolerans]PJK27902.1 hypothetical protein CVT23_19365 [Minwuia thermotolerans]
MARIYARTNYIAHDITPGKLYPVREDDGHKFTIVDDSGRELACHWRGCAHLGREDWERFETDDPRARASVDEKVNNLAMFTDFDPQIDELKMVVRENAARVTELQLLNLDLLHALRRARIALGPFHNHKDPTLLAEIDAAIAAAEDAGPDR